MMYRLPSSPGEWIDREVEIPFPDVLGQPHHVRLDHRADDPADEDLRAEYGEQLRLRPPVQLGRVRVDEREDDEPGGDGEQRLEHLEREVDPVLELVHRHDPEVQKGDADGVHR